MYICGKIPTGYKQLSIPQIDNNNDDDDGAIVKQHDDRAIMKKHNGAILNKGTWWSHTKEIMHTELQ